MQPHFDIGLQVIYLFLLAIPVACIAWTVTHEEVFREPREYCVKKSETSRNILQRKFFYLFTCEYCFSHYVAAFLLVITGYRLMFDDWRGILIALFSLVWIANQYMSLFARMRITIKLDKVEIAAIQESTPEGSEKPNVK
jgi:hypothetical protein